MPASCQRKHVENHGWALLLGPQCQVILFCTDRMSAWLPAKACGASWMAMSRLVWITCGFCKNYCNSTLLCLNGKEKAEKRNATKFFLVIDASYLRCWRIWFSTAVSSISPHRWSIGSVSGCGLRYERHNLPNQTREKNSRVRVHSWCFICHTISSVSLGLLHDRTCRSCLNVDFTKIDLLPWEYSPKQLIKSAGYRCRWTLAILLTVTCMSVAMVTIIVRMLLPAWKES